MAAWAPVGEFADFHNPESEAEWDDLLEAYGEPADSPLGRVFEIARALRVRTVVEEFRYVDPDYRSEYSAFWSKRFEDRSPFARRLLFFRHGHTLESFLNSKGDCGFVGYCTVRPTSPGRVGRTMLATPRRFGRAVVTTATDRISLFGKPLEVSGVPFVEQDAVFLRCAHSALWVCHYLAARRGLVGRRATAELAELSPATLDYERSLPSPGLNVNQLQAIFASTGQPALYYGISQLPDVEGVETPTPETYPGGALKPAGYWDTRIFSVICRYLNAGFPVLVGTSNHAFVIVGWFRERGRIRFIACDDQHGPYEVINSPFTDRRAPWKVLMIPLPPKVFLSGEVAESTAHYELRGLSSQGGAPEEWRKLREGIANGEVSFRTFLRSNHAYKSKLTSQKRGSSVEDELRVARLPHYVWVVEVQDRRARSAGRPCVLAEAVIDSTSSDSDPGVLALSVPGATVVVPPDGANSIAVGTTVKAWRSHLD